MWPPIRTPKDDKQYLDERAEYGSWKILHTFETQDECEVVRNRARKYARRGELMVFPNNFPVRDTALCSLRKLTPSVSRATIRVSRESRMISDTLPRLRLSGRYLMMAMFQEETGRNGDPPMGAKTSESDSVQHALSYRRGSVDPKAPVTDDNRALQPFNAGRRAFLNKE